MEKDLDQEVNEKIRQLESYFCKVELARVPSGNCSLMSGKSGSLLVQSLFYNAYADIKTKAAIEVGIDQLIDFMGSPGQLSPTFCNGLAGIGWLIQHLQRTSIIDIDADCFLSDLDNELEIGMNKFIQADHFDILHGALGLGVYFLARNRRDKVETLFLSLKESCVRFNNEIMWQRYDTHNYKDFIYDFGLAHGNASIVYFLTKCCSIDLYAEECRHTLSGLFRFFSANIQQLETDGSFFPSFRFVKDYKTARHPQRSRLAWCYGDLGILHTLFIASRIIEDKEHEEMYLSMLEKTARIPLEKSLVQDAGFCHGASGIGYIFYSLYRYSGRQPFYDAFIYWLKVTLSFGNEADGIMGYRFLAGKAGWVRSNELLSGLGGASILLLHYAHAPENRSWDECFFLS